MDDLDQVLTRVFSGVVETAAFMFCEVRDKSELEPQTEPCVLASIRFTGPRTGTLAIAAPQALCAEMAANVLGAGGGDELTDAQAQDTLKEILNVTCGNFLTVLAGDGVVFDLSVPEVALLAPAQWADLTSAPAVVALDLDGYPVLLKLRMEGQRP